MFGYPDGRLLRGDPATGDIHAVIDQIRFANVVAVAHDGSYLSLLPNLRSRLQRWRFLADSASAFHLP